MKPGLLYMKVISNHMSGDTIIGHWHASFPLAPCGYYTTIWENSPLLGAGG